MEERVAIVGLFVKDNGAAKDVNSLLHKYADKVIGRMGVPDREHDLSIISVIVRASSNEISALSGALGRIEGVTVKSMQAPI